MKVYLGEMLLPVDPEQIVRKIKNQNKTKTLVSGEQVNFVLPAGLTEITLTKVMLPNTALSFANTSDSGLLEGSNAYLAELERLKLNREVFTFTANESEDGLCRTGAKDCFLVTLESYTITQAASEGNNVMVDINLKQYVNHGLQTVELVTTDEVSDIKVEKTKKKKRAEKKTKTTTYTVQEGDTLWAIAKKFYGDGSKCPYLAELNDIKNPNIIRVGQVLKIGSTSDANAYKSTSTTKSTNTTKELKSVTQSISATNGQTPMTGSYDIKSQPLSVRDLSKLADKDIALISARQRSGSTVKQTDNFKNINKISN